MIDQIISIRFLSYEGFQNKRFAFAEMGRSFVQKWQSNGLTFAKHLGVGAGNGFSVWPDLPMLSWEFSKTKLLLIIFLPQISAG
jgi:hypothetical protein